MLQRDYLQIGQGLTERALERIPHLVCFGKRSLSLGKKKKGGVIGSIDEQNLNA